MNKFPKTVEEAVDLLIDSMIHKDLESVRETSEDDLIMLHMGLGAYIRNNFGLWGGNRELFELCASMEKNHPSTIDPERVYGKNCSLVIDFDREHRLARRVFVRVRFGL
jgi:hypothetical protein